MIAFRGSLGGVVQSSAVFAALSLSTELLLGTLLFSVCAHMGLTPVGINRDTTRKEGYARVMPEGFQGFLSDEVPSHGNNSYLSSEALPLT